VRALAAIAVAAGHLGQLLLANVNARSPIFWKAFSVLLGQGHKAVIVFFVMSGYLIGKHVHVAFRNGTWSWVQYAVRRMTRLWIVLIPALILTAIWDFIGSRLLHGSLYAGLRPEYYGKFLPNPAIVPTLLNPKIFLGNLLFLQNGIVVPSFGTNVPLWSLANEFWYYVIFPLLFCALCRARSTSERLIAFLGSLVLVIILPFDIVEYGIIWLFGYAVAILEPFILTWPRRRRRNWAIFLTAIFVVHLYIVPRFTLTDDKTSDFITGIIFSALMIMLTKLESGSKFLSKTANVGADFSYTLYLTHFPFIAVFLCAFNDNKRMPLNLESLLVFCILLSIVIVYAFCIYCIFERNTSSLQSLLLRSIPTPKFSWRSLE
jgi:peptidoglycan/LPS O-acetylase OafA/YrhL